MKTLLSFSFDESYRYWPKFIESVRRNFGIDSYCGLALGLWRNPIPPDCVPMQEAADLFGRPVVQHGAFLKTLRNHGQINDSTTILFVDVDAKFQRPFDAEELRLIEGVGVNHYLVGPNRIHDRPELWGDEAPRVLPTEAYHHEYRGQFDRVPVFNTGFLAMNAMTYEQVYGRALNFIHNYGHWFQHHAATQLFLCAAMWELGLRSLAAPLTLSAHGHCGTPPGLKIVDDEAYIASDQNGNVRLDKVAYAHMLCGL